jgi:hypothetical protein
MADAAHGLLMEAGLAGRVDEWLRGLAGATRFGPACVACLSGPTGAGKMTLLRAVANAAGATLLVLTQDRLPSAADVVDQIEKWCTTQAFDDAFDALARPKIIVLDALDAYLATERTLLATLASKFKRAMWRPLPFVVLCPAALDRRVAEAFRGCARFAVAAPCAADARLFLLGRGGAPELVPRLAAALAADGNVAAALERLVRGDANEGPHREAHVSELWTRAISRDDARALLEQDPVFHPLRLHENALSEIDRRRAPARDKRRAMTELLRCLVDWDQSADAFAVEHAASAAQCLARLPARKADDGAPTAAFTKLLCNLSLQKRAQRVAERAALPLFPIDHVGHHRMNAA